MSEEDNLMTGTWEFEKMKANKSNNLTPDAFTPLAMTSPV
jgi:hypothetical protein